MTDARKKNIKAILHTLRQRGFRIYERPYELNIVGVRNDSTTPNKFDDTLYVFWKNDAGKWEGKWFNVTTDPGTYYLLNPINNLGTAILKEGQYIDAYEIGQHKNLGESLIQTGGKVTVIRDYDRNAILDFYNGKEETGYFGINLHRAGASGTTIDVDNWSAGCTVFENADDFKEFMKLAKRHAALYGNKFTYTLIDERAYNRAMKRWLTYLGIGLIGAAAIWVGYRAYVGKPITPKL